MNWIEERFRKVYWEFNNLPEAPGIAVNFDRETAGAVLRRAHIQAVHLTSRDMYGYCYYETQSGAKHPHLQRNLLKEVIEVCHENDVKVISTFQLVFDDRAAKAHPDWRAVGATGEHYTTWGVDPMCINTPYPEEYVLPQLRELVELYDIDGVFLDPIANRVEQLWCYCPRCRARFKEESGEEIPREKGSARGLRCTEWRRKLFNDFRSICSETIHQTKSHLLVTVNNTFCGTHHPAGPPDYVDFLTKEVKTFTGHHMDQSYFGRYLATVGKPFHLLCNRLLHGWLDWDMKPVTMLKYECAAMIAAGATCCVGDKLYPDGTLEEEFYNNLGEVFEFIKEREEFCLKATPVPYIAILHSAPTMHHQGYELAPTLAAHRMLQESSLHFSIINEDTLLCSLDDYQTLILPEQSNLGDKVVRTIRTFVENGGGLIASGSTSLFTEAGKRRRDFGLADVFGVEHRGEYPHPYAYFRLTDESIGDDIRGLPMHIDGEFLCVESTSAKAPANLADRAYLKEIPGRFNLGSFAPVGADTGYPAVTFNRFGRGSVAYISGSVFRSYWKKNRPQTKYLVRNLVRLVTTDELLEVDADACVEVSLFQQDSRLVLHLLFGQIEKIFDGPRWAAIESIPPVYDVAVKLRVAGNPKRVVQIPEGRDLPWEMRGERLSFSVPEFRIHTCVVVDRRTERP